MKTNKYLLLHQPVEILKPIKAMPNNRCTALTLDEALSNGYFECEFNENNTNINRLVRSIETYGIMPSLTIPVFEKKNGERFLEDYHHFCTAALICAAKHKDKKYYVDLIIKKETKEYTMKKAQEMMLVMNQNGSEKWSFLPIIRNYKTANAKLFLKLCEKYIKSVSAVAVIADAVLNVPTSTKRINFKSLWAVKEDTTWRCADDYLGWVTDIKCNKKISQSASDVLRKVYICAMDNHILGFVKALFNNGIIVSIPKGRPTTLEWFEEIFKMFPNTANGMGLNAKQRANYRNFLRDLGQKLNDMRTANNNKSKSSKFSKDINLDYGAVDANC